MTCLENIFVISTLFIVLVTIQATKAEEIDAKRGPAIHTLTPTPRRRSDPEFLKWDSEVNAMLDDDYEGTEYAGNEYVRPYFGFPRISRSGGRFYSKLGEGSQETIKRGGPGGAAGMWFGPRLGRMQKRSPTKEHI
ncbi:cardio acceleratory peptide 2b-like [Contarinia nasturtii]|uniref:cardio acceleratory peptide 2b-like n=1 Tax=Contarinia nasturtii TaxID=265458 RepID=UPI0012D4C28B|nr:cardio acceleratory peptide 2b-like [Contarinia nasturtii]